MRPPLFVELCAGTAALSLRLAHPRARPPVSRMGAKTGYADAILRCLGLYPGQGAEHYLWCEPDAGVRLLLHAYRDRELATAAADIIRSWKNEEPRALWERLRAEGPAVCPPVDPREVARWLFQIGGSHQGMGTGIFGGNLIGWEGTAHGQGPKRPLLARLPDALDPLPTLPATIADDARKVDPREVARVARIISANRLVNPDPETWKNTGDGGYRHGGAEFCTPIDRLADAMAAVPQVDGAAVVDDARAVDAREVARFLYGSAASYDPSRPWSGFLHPEEGGRYGAARADVARRTAELPTLPATITDDARPVDPPQLPPGVIAYIDPPYLNTTGYAHAFPRSEWLPVVRRWQAAGALVAVSEAEPIPDLIAEGWHAVEITGERKGQKRTFSKQQREFLTMSEPPRWRPAVQGSLFG